MPESPAEPTGARPLDADERRELSRLRREIAELRGDTAAHPRSGHRTWRGVGCGVLLALTAILVLAAVPARYLRAELLDTDRYVTTVTPLADDPAVRAAVTDRVTDRLMARLDVERVTADALTALTREFPRVPGVVVGLAPVLADQARSYVHDTVADFVASDRFRTLWSEANRRAHTALVATLTGRGRDAVRVGDDGTVTLELGPVVEAVRAELTQRGFAFAEAVPDTDASFVLLESPRLASARTLTSALDTAATILPLAAALTAIAAVLAAPRGARRRAFVLVGVVAAAAMALAAIGIALGRATYLRELPDTVRPDAAAAVFDTLTVPLHTAVRAVFVLAIVLAAAGYLTGTARSATALRHRLGATADRLRAPGRAPNRLESTVAAHRTPIRVAVVVLAAATVVCWPYPTGLVVALIALVAVAALLAVELTARPARADAGKG